MRSAFLFRCIAWSLALGSGFVAMAEDPVPSARIAPFSGDCAAAISYTFDDNLRDQYTLAMPMLNEVGFKGTFFVIAGKTADTPAEGEQKQRDANVRGNWGGISWPELKELADQGHEISSHTWSHRNMPKLSVDEVEAEISKASEAIKTHIGKPALTLAFPFNASTPAVQATALKYHVAYRSFQVSTGDRSTVDSLNAWADQLVKEKKWGVMMTHAVGKGYAALSDPEILHTQLKYVKSREGDFWVDPFANIARYEKERDDAKLEMTGVAGNVAFVIGGKLDAKMYDVPLTIVIDAPGVISARADRAGEVLPVHVNKDSIHVQASPSTQPVNVKWN